MSEGRHAFAAWLLCLVALAVATTSCRGPTAPPSIILLMVDTLRADHLGAYGFDGSISPNLDALAVDSVVFDHCFSQAPWTKPAVASVFTGLHPQLHRVTTHYGQYGDPSTRLSLEMFKTDVLADEAATLAESLRQGGYDTAAFVANPWLRADHGFAQGFDVYDDRLAGNTATAEAIVEAARVWLRARPQGEPFFLYLHFMDVHGPYDAPESDYLAVQDAPGLGPSRPLTEAERGSIPPYLRAVRWRRHARDDRLEHWRGRYAAGVRALDRRLGPFLNELRDSGVLDRAILVLTADHGEELHEHGGWDHGGTLYDEQLHVPLFIRPPGGENGGRRVRGIVSLIDLMPTLLGAAGLDVPASAQGRDLSAQVGGRPADSPDAVSFASGVKGRPEAVSLRTPHFKLIQNIANHERLFFDLARDPGEQRPLTPAPSDRAAVERRLLRHLEDLAGRQPLEPAEVPIPDELRERLRALGYLP